MCRVNTACVLHVVVHVPHKHLSMYCLKGIFSFFRQFKFLFILFLTHAQKAHRISKRIVRRTFDRFVEHQLTTVAVNNTLDTLK